MKSKRMSILVMAVVLVVSSQVTLIQAGLIGHEITAQWVYPTMSDVIETHDFTVGSAVELPPEVIVNDSELSIDIGDDYILFTCLSENIWQNNSANGWQFIDKNGTIEEIVGFSIGEITGSVTGLEPEDLVFTSNSIFANFGNSGLNGENVFCGKGSTIRLDIAFVPEPCSLVLLGLGGLMLRRKYRR